MKVPKEYSSYEEETNNKDTETVVINSQNNSSPNFKSFFITFLICKVAVIVVHYVLYYFECDFSSNPSLYWWFGNPIATPSSSLIIFLLVHIIIFTCALPTEKWIFNYYFNHSPRLILFGMAALKLFFIFNISCFMMYLFNGSMSGITLFGGSIIVATLTIFTIIDRKKHIVIYICNFIVFFIGLFSLTIRLNLDSRPDGSLVLFSNNMLGKSLVLIDNCALICSLLYPLIVYIAILVFLLNSKKSNPPATKK